MAVRPTVQLGDPRLKAKNARVEKVDELRIKRVIADLVDSMHEAQLIGMAAAITVCEVEKLGE